MAKALYNPRTLGEGDNQTPNTADIKGFVWSHARWDLPVGELKKFPDDVADALLRHCEFLTEVTKDNYESVKKAMEVKQFKCRYCDYETNTKIALIGHAKTHKDIEAEDSFLSTIEEAGPKRAQSMVQRGAQTPDEREGIPSGGTKYAPQNDKDGVGWYGEGWSEDTAKTLKTFKG